MPRLAIDLENVEFSWPGDARVFTRVDLGISEGERVFLQGASGSGKSTLLSLIAGVLTPQAGSIRVLGTPLETLSAGERDRFRARNIGFVFQMFNLLPYLDVRANVLLPLRFCSERRQRLNVIPADAEAARLLAALGLTDLALLERATTQLSMGQQQRVAAARALIGRPPILIADEPTSSLDTDTREEFLQLLMSECATNGTTLLFVSHDASLRRLFDRTILLHEIEQAAR